MFSGNRDKFTSIANRLPVMVHFWSNAWFTISKNTWNKQSEGSMYVIQLRVNKHSFPPFARDDCWMELKTVTNVQKRKLSSFPTILVGAFPRLQKENLCEFFMQPSSKNSLQLRGTQTLWSVRNATHYCKVRSTT